MLVTVYRTEYTLNPFKKSVYAILNYMPSVLFEEGETAGLGIEPKVIDNPFVPGEYYQTTNNKIVNCLTVDYKNAYFGQFKVELAFPKRIDNYAGKGYGPSVKHLKVLLGDRVTPTKMHFFALVMFPNSKQFANPDEALKIIFKDMLEKHMIRSSCLNDQYIERIFKQQWLRNVKETPMGKYIMSSLQASLKSLGISYGSVLSYYQKLADQDEDKKASFMATKELERLVKEGEYEEKKIKDLNELSESSSSDGFEVAKRIGDGDTGEGKYDVPDDMQKAIMEASDELDDLGDEYINQGMSMEEAVVIEENDKTNN